MFLEPEATPGACPAELNRRPTSGREVGEATMRKACLLIAVLTALCLIPSWAISAESDETPPARIKNELGMELVLIPAGSFMMGSPGHEPHRQGSEAVHKVTISKPFYIQTTEVTLAQWREIMGKSWLSKRPGGPKSPVVQVSWFQAQRFIKKLNRKTKGGYSLPTEAQWEYAARAGTTTAYPWGEAVNCHLAMYANNTRKRDDCVSYFESKGFEPDEPAPVGSFAPNAWGLFDVAGNVWEWCSDWYAPYPDKAVVDPKGPDSGTWRVRRGGSWFGGPKVMRTGNRNFAHPASKYTTLGFRVVKEAP